MIAMVMTSCMAAWMTMLGLFIFVIIGALVYYKVFDSMFEFLSEIKLPKLPRISIPTLVPKLAMAGLILVGCIMMVRNINIVPCKDKIQASLASKIGAKLISCNCK